MNQQKVYSRIIKKEQFGENAYFAKIKNLNEDKKVHGIIIQSPVPKKYDEDLLNSYILKEKDVDGSYSYH